MAKSTTEPMAHDLQPTADHHRGDDVLLLLRQLRARLHRAERSSFRQTLPAFERLLAGSTSADSSSTSVVGKLSRVRLLLRQHADMFLTVERMDRAADWCLRYALDTQAQSDAFPMDAALRLLLALSGGSDGRTFRLEDPTRVAVLEVHSAPLARTLQLQQLLLMRCCCCSSAATKQQEPPPKERERRIGERIRMKNVGLVLESSTMFDAEAVPLRGEAVLAQHQFGLFRDASQLTSSLWTPEVPSAIGNTNTSKRSRRETEQFFAGDSSEADCWDPDLSFVFGGADTTASAAAAAFESRREAEVFFFDGSREVHCGASDSDWADDTSSQTASSSEDAMSFELADYLKPARLYAWEDIGDAERNSPAAADHESATSLLAVDPGVAIPEGTLEVFEGDVVEDALRALCGVESAIFRRDVQATVFRLPERRALKLRFGTPASLASALKVFREAGSSFLRLEFLATYYAQDSRRGGKTLQAMGDALLLFLYGHRSAVEKLSTTSEGISTLTAAVAKTRHLCRQLRFVARVFRCHQPHFWPLILDRKLTRTSLEDARGRRSELATWFLIKASSPFLQVLTEFVSLGTVSDATDPYDEFELTTWSLRLTELSFRDRGDGLLAGDFGPVSVESMMPVFLRRVVDQVIRLGVVQRVLHACASGQRKNVSVLAEPLQLRQTTRTSKEESDDAEKQGEANESVASTDEADTESQLQLTPTDDDDQQQTQPKSTPRPWLDALPDIHGFFSHHGTDDDLQILIDALSVSRERHELQSFALLVHRCVESPVNEVGRSLDRLGVELFLEDLELMHHLRWLHNIMLMSEGLCMDIFARDLLAGLKSPTRVAWGISDRLSSALTLAMIESRIHSEEHAPRFHYALSDAVLHALGNMTVGPEVRRLLEGIELEYTVDWPLGAVVSAASLRSYSAMHRRLLFFRLTSMELSDTWMITRKSVRGTSDADALLKSCDDVFSKTQALIGAFSEAFVLLSAWAELEFRASRAANLQTLRQAHELYVSTARSCCFLDDSSTEIRAAIDRVLAVAWTLSAFVRTFESRLGGMTVEAAWVHEQWLEHDAAMRDLVRKAQSAQGDGELSVREFSQHLCVRLNFNAFYPEHDA